VPQSHSLIPAAPDGLVFVSVPLTLVLSLYFIHLSVVFLPTLIFSRQYSSQNLINLGYIPVGPGFETRHGKQNFPVALNVQIDSEVLIEGPGVSRGLGLKLTSLCPSSREV
jgi:hypothetical protein